MMVRVTIDIDVGDDPVADAITAEIEMRDCAPGDDDLSASQWVARAVSNAVRSTLGDWTVLSADCTVGP